MWPIILALLAAVLPAWLLISHAWRCWSYRHIPGSLGLPLLGCLLPVLRHGLHEYTLECNQKYGPIFKMALGPVVWIVLGDPDLAKKVNMKLLERTIGAQFATNKRDEESRQSGLAAAKPELWRRLRLAWQPAFHSSSMQQYSSLMDKCAVRLRAKLAAAADSGELVDMYKELGNMTMEVVGTTAFGTEFHTLDPEQPQSELVVASRTIFSSGALTKTSYYILAALLLPWARKPLEMLADKVPDKRLVAVNKALGVIRTTSMDLISSWKRDQAAGITEPHTDAANGTTAAMPDDTAAASVKKHAATEAADLAVGTAKAKAAASDWAAASANGSLLEPEGVQQVSQHSDKPMTAANGVQNGVDGVRAPAFEGAVPGAAAAAKSGRASGVAAGSFLGLFLGERERSKDLNLNDNQVMAQSNTFILAGYDTTANTLAYAVYLLSCHPGAQQRLLQEVDAFGCDRPVAYEDMDQFPYTDAVVRETLRLYPPATLTNRKVPEKPAEGMDLTPTLHLKPGQVVVSAMYAFHHNEKYWPRAMEFLPQRFLPEGAAVLGPTTEAAWMPFGAGPRMCIGWRFALQEAKTALVRLYQEFTFELAPGQMPLQVTQAATLNPAKGVMVHIQRRASMASP